MKQMKRAAGLLLALVLVLSMAACGKKDGDGGDSQSGFQRGTIENGIYTNTFVGIGCQLSDDWTYYTDEQLAELSGVVAESSEEMQKAMEDGKSTYDMFASAMEGLVTINVVYEDLGALYGKLLDEAGYLEIAVPKLEDALASMGLSNVKVEQTPVQFAGLVREGAVISGEMDGVPMYETLVCIKQEGYMCCVTMCSWTEDITADLAELLGRKNMAKGVKLTIDNEVVTVECFVVIAYGSDIPAVAANIQDAVITAVESMTGLKVAAVNVDICGICSPKN